MYIRIFKLAVAIVFIISWSFPCHGEDFSNLQAGVVKITAKPSQGAPKIGTGFIVRLERDEAYIVTAAHVVTGDPQPTIEFFTRRNVPVQSKVLALEGDDEVKGLALLLVRGAGNVPEGVQALQLAPAIRLTGGQDIIVIGFPRGAGPWAIIRGNIVSRQGRALDFSASLDEGSSGGPIIQNDKVVGLVAGLGRFGLGVTAASLQDYLDGFGFPSATDRQPTSLREIPLQQDKQDGPRRASLITGKDGVPMVLVPSGTFMMGDSGREASPQSVYLDAFYIDKFEVTLRQYLEYLSATGRDLPE